MMEPRKKTLTVTIIRSAGDDSADTHHTRWFKQIWHDIEGDIPDRNEFRWADPFARNCRIAKDFTNDLNPDTLATNNMDCLDFLRMLGNDAFDGVIFDPPFSDRMAKDHYDGFGVNLYSSDQKKLADCMVEIARILRPGGMLLKLGFNSNRPHKNFDLEKLWIINKGGYRNDTQISLWVNNMTSLLDFVE